MKQGVEPGLLFAHFLDKQAGGTESSNAVDETVTTSILVFICFPTFEGNDPDQWNGLQATKARLLPTSTILKQSELEMPVMTWAGGSFRFKF